MDIRVQNIWILLVVISGHLTSGLVFTQEPEDLFVVPNLALWWHCVAESPVTTDISYRWTFNGGEVSRSGSRHLIFPNGTLFINGIQTGDEGRYQCLAADGVDQVQSPPATLAIAYMDVIFALNPQSQTGRLGDRITLLCEIDSWPTPLITWQHNDIPVATENVVMVTEYRSRLLLVSVGYEDAGRYQCIARNPLTNQTKFSNTAVLTLQGGPQWLVEPNPMIINKNSIGYLHCVAEGNPGPESTWYSVQGVGQETALTTRDRFMVFDNGTLRISDVQLEDAGFYKCVATNAIDSISKTVRVSVTELPATPIFTSRPSNTTVEEGDTVNWFCAASGQPPPTISWRPESGLVGGARWTFPYPGALIIDPVSRADMGWFLCLAENAAGENTHRVYLNVQYPPSLLDFPPPTVLVEAGDRVNLPCNVDANPRPEIQWTTPLGDVTESNGITVSSNGSLLIQSAAPIHMGEYMCNARNYLDFVSAITELQVRASPVFLSPPMDQDAVLGSTLVIDCLTTGYPPPTIIWYLPPTGWEVTVGYGDGMYTVLENGSLSVEKVGVEHEALFRCSAENELGVIVGSANIKVLGPPVFDTPDYSVLEHEGASIVLDCQPTGRPNPIVQWAKDGLSLPPGAVTEVFTNNTLYIASLTQSQYGTYQCFATNEVGSDVLEIMVLQPNSPVFTVKPDNRTGNASQSLFVPCAAESTLTPDITWFAMGPDGRLQEVEAFNPEVDVGEQRIHVDIRDTLVFQELQVTDEGWYICVANNSMGDISADAYIDVQIPAFIVRAITQKSGDLGEETTLNCEGGGKPLPRMAWKTPSGADVSPTDDRYIIGNGSLTIKVANVEDHMGTWLCVACNILGCAEQPIELYVRGPPVITEVHGYMDGLARVVSCHAEGTPFPEVRYYWGDLVISPIFPPRGHSISADGPTLRIHRDTIDSVSYKCRAINQYGVDTRVFVVPSEPHALTLEEIGSRFALLNWQPPDVLGGFPELNYTIHYRYTIPGTLDPIAGNQRGVLSMPYTLSGLQPYRDYTFMVASYNVLGPSAYTVPVRARTLQDAPDPIRKMKLDFAGEVVHVTWEEPVNMNGNTSSIEYHILATEVLNREVVEFVKVPHGGPLETYLTSLGYDDEFLITATAVNTAIGRSSEAVQDRFIVRHRVPFMVPVLTRVASMGPESIEVEWDYPDREGRELSGFLVRVTLPDENDAVHSVARVDGYLTDEYRVKGLEERHTYSVSVAAFSREGSGPYSGEEVVVTSYAILSPLAYEGSNKLTMRGTTIAIIFGAIFGILLVLVVVLLVWQWYRLHQQKTEKLVADIYNQKKRMMMHHEPIYHPPPYTSVPTSQVTPTPISKISGSTGIYQVAAAQEVASGSAKNVRNESKPPRPSRPPSIPGYTVVPIKSKPTPRVIPQRPRAGSLYSPGKTYSYKVSPRGSVVLPVRKRLYKKKDDPHVAYTEMSGSPGYPPRYTQTPQRGRRPGHPINPRNGQQPPGSAAFPGPRPPYPTTARPRRSPGSLTPKSLGGPRPGQRQDPQLEDTKPKGRGGSPQEPARVAVYAPGPSKDDRYHGPRRTPQGGVAVQVPARPLEKTLSASEQNLVNHQKRGPSPSPLTAASPSPSVASSHPSASTLRSSRVRRSPPRGSPASSGHTPRSPPASRTDTGNDSSGSSVSVSVLSDVDVSPSLSFSDETPILSRLHEAHPLPNEGPSNPSTPDSLLSRSDDDDPIYAVPNKAKKGSLETLPESSSTKLDNRMSSDLESLSPVDSLTPSVDSMQDLSLDRKGRVFSSSARRGPKGKAGGRNQAKNLGRNPLPGPDFWS